MIITEELKKHLTEKANLLDIPYQQLLGIVTEAIRIIGTRGGKMLAKKLGKKHYQRINKISQETKKRRKLACG